MIEVSLGLKVAIKVRPFQMGPHFKWLYLSQRMMLK